MSSVVFPLKVSNNKNNNQNNKLIIQSVSNRQIFNKIQAESDKLQKLIHQTANSIQRSLTSTGTSTTNAMDVILKGTTTLITNPVLTNGSIYYFNFNGLFINFLATHTTLHHYDLTSFTVHGQVTEGYPTVINGITENTDVGHIVEFKADIIYVEQMFATCKGYDVNNNVLFNDKLISNIDYVVKY